MQIENNSAYLASLYTRASHAAANTNAGQASTPAPSGSQETSATNTTKAAPITGVTGSNLSKEVMDQLIAATQETGTAETTLPKAIQHGLDDIANDPAYAAKRAEELGTYPDAVFFPAESWPFPTPENPNKPAPSESEISAWRAKIGTRMAEAEQTHQQRNAYYEDLMSQNLPPAEVYAKLLEFNAKLPESYNDTVGFSVNSPNQTWSEYHNAAQDYLQSLIEQKNAAATSVKTADLTKAAG